MAGTEPILDESCFRDLAGDLGCEAIAHRFMTEFRDLLPARVNRIQGMVRIMDHDAAMDAVLSLAASASMVGGLQVAQQCASIGRSVKNSDFTTAARATLALDAQTQALARKITGLLERFDAASTPGSRAPACSGELWS